MIQEAFIASLSNYTQPDRCEVMWKEVEQAYTVSGRHYHTVAHLNHLLKELLSLQTKFQQWDTLIFALVYHDVIYSVIRHDNEARSADLAVSRLQSIAFPQQEIDRCRTFILATQRHEAGDHEVNLFTDADLSILGGEAVAYQQYVKQVRKEYNIYPDIVYRPGRKKVLSHFLQMPRIFKTPEFEKYEMPARDNLKWEMEELGGT